LKPGSGAWAMGSGHMNTLDRGVLMIRIKRSRI